LNATPAGLYQIGEVCDRVGLSLRTLRYWDEVGIVTPTARTEGGFRLYSEDDIERILVVMDMKPLKLTLEEMRELIDLLTGAARPDQLDGSQLEETVSTLSTYAARADERIAKVERQLAGARTLRTLMTKSIRACRQAATHEPHTTTAAGE
jgi:DNA-binding transcriptional MerR regulator